MKHHLPLITLLLLLLALPARGQFIYDGGFADQQTYTLVGAASIQGQNILVSPARGGIGIAGAIWHDYPVRVNREWTCSFTFAITNQGGKQDLAGLPGGDGLALVIQNLKRPEERVGPIGATGGGIGYAGISNSVALELDTYLNDETGITDPSSNHISLQSRGIEPNSYSHEYSLGQSFAVPTLSDGAEHRVTVHYSPGVMTVSVDSCASPSLIIPVDLDTLLLLDEGRAWIGITGASKSAYQNHWLSQWCFSYSDLCGCSPMSADTIVVHDTLSVRDTLTIRDTITRIERDTVTVHTRDTIHLVERDTLTLVETDTLIERDTVRSIDTLLVPVHDTTTVIRRDTVVEYDSIPCASLPLPPIDCNGTFRQLELLEYWRGLLAVYPNPADGLLTIVYEVPLDGWRTLQLYDETGGLVTTLQYATGPAGRFTVDADVSGLAPGLYLLMLNVGGVHYHRMVVIER